MKINKEELYKLYMEWVEEVAEVCDWKTTFGPEEIIEAIATILENNPYESILLDESVNNDYMEYSWENTLNQIRLNEKKIKMDKEHPLTNTLINLKEFMEDLSNYDAPESSDGWSLSNLPSHFWQTLGECISDIEDYIKNEQQTMSSQYRKIKYESEGPYGSVEEKYLYIHSHGTVDIYNVYDDNGEHLFSFSETGFDMGSALAVAFTNWQDPRMELVPYDEWKNKIK